MSVAFKAGGTHGIKPDIQQRKNKVPAMTRRPKDMIYRKISLRGVVSLILLNSATFLMFSCATVYHGSLAKGSIIGTFNSNVYLGIQGGDRVSVGQELNVYKVIMNPQEPLARPASKGVQTGKVKITEIFGNGIAKAEVISGKAEKGDIVKLVRPK